MFANSDPRFLLFIFCHHFEFRGFGKAGRADLRSHVPICMRCIKFGLRDGIHE